MFSDCQDCTIKLYVQWEELLQATFKGASQTARVHGLEWRLHLGHFSFLHHIWLTVGFSQIPSAPVSCATDIRYILDSMDPNGARYTMTRGTVAVCEMEQECVYLSGAFIEQHLLNDGWLTVFAKLRVFKPVPFTPIPAHLGYSFSAPLFMPLFEWNGLIYMLAPQRAVSEGEETSKYAVQCMKAFVKESPVTLGVIDVNDFIGASISMETREIVVTQVDEEEGRIQLDVVGLEGGVETRIYPLPQSHIQFNKWSEAVRTSEGMMMAARGFDGEEDVVRFQFWRVAREMTLYLELTRPARRHEFEFQSINYSTLYCIFTSPGGRQFVLVCDLEEPSVWREYEMCPVPAVKIKKKLSRQLFALWLQPVFVARITTSGGRQRVLFKLEFTTTDCLLTPFLALPHRFGFSSDYIACFSPYTMLVLTSDHNFVMVSVLPLVPPPLKTLAVVNLQKLLGKMKEDYRDALGQPIWTQWKKKLAKLIGHKTLFCYV